MSDHDLILLALEGQVAKHRLRLRSAAVHHSPDSDSWCAARVAELREQGVDAKVEIVWKLTAIREYRCAVVLPDGSREEV